MADDNNNEPSKNGSETLTWIGMTLILRTKGSNEILQRSFPFWGPSVEWALTEAKRQNKLPKQERSYWTHVVVHSHLEETATGFNRIPVTTEEHKV